MNDAVDIANLPGLGAIGQKLRRKEDERRLTGKGRFSDDFHIGRVTGVPMEPRAALGPWDEASMAEINHEIKIEAPPESVYRALTTVAGLSAWHTSQVAGTGGVGSTWRFMFTGRPEFRWRVLASEPPGHVAWRCVHGPGDAVGTTVSFAISAIGDGRTFLECSHAGWPGTQGNFRKCNTLWGVLLHHLKRYAETGEPAPAFA